VNCGRGDKCLCWVKEVGETDNEKGFFKKIRIPKRRFLTNEEKEELIEHRHEESLFNKPVTSKFLFKFTLPTIISFIVMAIFGQRIYL